MYLLFEMPDTYTETILIEFPLPDFLIHFKDTCVNTLVPGLLSIVHDLENPQSNQSTLAILSAIFIFLLVKSIVSNLFTFKAPRTTLVSQEEVDSEIRLLTNEIRKMKESLKKIIEQNAQGGIATKHSASSGGYDSHDVKKLIAYYEKSGNDFNSLAEFILNSQENILKQMKAIKKNKIFGDRTPSQGSRGSFQSELNQNPKQVQPIKTEIEPETTEPEPIVQSERRPAPKPFKAPPPAAGRKRGVPPPPVPR